MIVEAYALRSVHGAKGRALVLRSEVGLTGAEHEKRTGWANIAKVGEWRGHPSGAFEVTTDHLREVIRAFDEQETPVPFDYEHASTIEGAEAPAAGWIQKLELRGEQLWALVEWTERGAEYIRRGEYRFSSAVLFFDAPDKTTGRPRKCRLHSVALTNTPFMDGLQSIALSDRAIRRARKLRMEIPKKDIIAAIESFGGTDLTPEAVTKLIEAIVASTAPDAGGEVEMSDGQRSVAAAESGSDPLAAIGARLAEASGLGPEDLAAALEKNLDAVLAALSGGGSGEGETVMAAKLAATQATVKSLSDRLAVYEKRDADAAKAALVAEVDALITDKRLDPSAREHMVKLAEKDAEAFRSLAKTLNPSFPAGLEASALPSAKVVSLSDKDPRVISLREQFKRSGVSDPAVIDKYVRAELARIGG